MPHHYGGINQDGEQEWTCPRCFEPHLSKASAERCCRDRPIHPPPPPDVPTVDIRPDWWDEPVPIRMAERQFPALPYDALSKAMGTCTPLGSVLTCIALAEIGQEIEPGKITPYMNEVMVSLLRLGDGYCYEGTTEGTDAPEWWDEHGDMIAVSKLADCGAALTCWSNEVQMYRLSSRGRWMRELIEEALS